MSHVSPLTPRALILCLPFCAFTPLAHAQATDGGGDAQATDGGGDAQATDGGGDAQPLEQRMDQLSGTVKSLQESVKTLQDDVKKLKAVKLSGFVQARYETNQSSAEGVAAKDGTAAAVKNQFSIRRARLRGSYTGEKGVEALVEIDAIPRGVSVRDALVGVTEPWSPLHFQFTAGQFKYPFGFENPRSTPDLELPEAPLTVRSFFPGERDRGLRITGGIKFAKLILGVLNGNGTEDISTKYTYQIDADGNGQIDEGEDKTGTSAALNFANVDRDHKRDILARLAVDFNVVSAGVSYYTGQWGSFQSVIEVMDPDTGKVVSYAGTDDLTYLQKTRLGADLQLNLSLLKALGNTALRFEFIQGHGLFIAGAESDVDARGWFVTLAQPLGKKFTVAARVDGFDPDLATEENEVTTIEPALLFFPNSAIKLTASYALTKDFLDASDSDGDGSTDKPDNQLTLQLQGRF